MAHELPSAIHEKLIEFLAGRRLRPEDAVLMRFPTQVQRDATAEDCLAFVRGAVNHRGIGRAGILAGQHQGLVEVVRPVVYRDRDWLRAGPGSGERSGGLQSTYRRRRRPKLIVGAPW